MKKQTQPLYLKDWMKFQPYSAPSHVDQYYFKMAKKVYVILTKPEYINFDGNFDSLNSDDNQFIALALTGYFEDIISNLGFWKAFTDKHQQKYGAILPFHTVNDNYIPGEINYEDICFLVWYFISLAWRREVFYPLDKQILAMGLDIFKLFEEEYEYAPENEKAREFLHLPFNVTDFYEVRHRIDYIVMKSYLFRMSMVDYFKEVTELLSEDEENEKNIDLYSKEIYDKTLLSNTMPLLGLKGKDVLAAILGENHPLNNSLKELTDKYLGKFIYESHDENYINLIHIASDTLIPVSRKSLDLKKHILNREILLIGIIKWIDEWWFSGTYVTLPNDLKIIREEKESVFSRNLFIDDIEKRKELTIEHYERFLKFNNGSEVAYFSNPNEAEGFIKKFNESWNESVQKRKNKLFGKNKTDDEKFEPIIEPLNLTDEKLEDVPTLLFFNRNAGIELLFGFNHLIADEKNPHYDPNSPEDEVYDLFTSNHAGGDLVKYLIEKNHIKNIKFPNEGASNMLMKNLDFMLYFWKRGEYSSIPQLTIKY